MNSNTIFEYIIRIFFVLKGTETEYKKQNFIRNCRTQENTLISVLKIIFVIYSDVVSIKTFLASEKAYLRRMTLKINQKTIKPA